MNVFDLVGGKHRDRVIRILQPSKWCGLRSPAKPPLTPTIRSAHIETLVVGGREGLRQEIVKVVVKIFCRAADTYNMSRITRLLVGCSVAIAIGVTTAAVPVEAAPTHSPAKPTSQVYTVKPGDYLYLISTKLQVSFDELLAVNGLTKKSVIHPGDELIVPAGGVLPNSAPATPATTGALYTVKRGDYFKRIASTLGVTIDDLLAANNFKKSTVIHAGMQLKVPVGGTPPQAPQAPQVPTGTSAKVKTVLGFASAQLGEPYRAIGAGPDSWDCSGLTMRAFAAVGITLPHYSVAQAKYGTAVDWNIQPISAGDLVFLATNGTIGHVGIATGPTTWIQSPGTGDVVRAGKIPMHRVFAVRRLVNGG